MVDQWEKHKLVMQRVISGEAQLVFISHYKQPTPFKIDMGGIWVSNIFVYILYNGHGN